MKFKYRFCQFFVNLFLFEKKKVEVEVDSRVFVFYFSLRIKILRIKIFILQINNITERRRIFQKEKTIL